jgi:hypothetical protein
MEQDSKLIFAMSGAFDAKLATFYQNIEHKNITFFIYALGLKLRSYHLKFATGDAVAPYAPIFKPLWDLDTWTKVTWGTDDVKDDDESGRDFDTALESIPYYDYLIPNAVKYNRPAWALFGLIGMMQGSLNQNQFEVRNKEDVFLKEDFIRCIKYLPTSFIEQYKNDLKYLFRYFDERNFKLIITSIENISIDEN